MPPLTVLRLRASRSELAFTSTPPTSPRPMTQALQRCRHCLNIIPLENSLDNHVRASFICREAEGREIQQGRASLARKRAWDQHQELERRVQSQYERENMWASEKEGWIGMERASTAGTGVEMQMEQELPATEERPAKQPRVAVEEVVDDEAPHVVPPPDRRTQAHLHKNRLGGDHVGGKAYLKAHIESTGVFASPRSFEIAELLMTTGLTDSAKEQHLQSVMYRGNTPWPTCKALNNDVDTLPHGPQFTINEINATSAPRPKPQFLVHRNALDLLRELFSNKAFDSHFVYAPARYWTTGRKKERVFVDMRSGNWWWREQEKLMKAGKRNATIAAVILSSDETNLSVMSGGQTAYPVYITVANIDKDWRRKPSKRTTLLLGYLPTDSFEDVENDNERRRLKAETGPPLHGVMLAPLKEAMEDGVEMWCPDGRCRLVFSEIAAYLADWPEKGEETWIPPSTRATARKLLMHYKPTSTTGVVKQWTGKESKEMLRQILPAVLGDLRPDEAQMIRSLVDFIFRAHMSSMTETDLGHLEHELDTFHQFKEVLVARDYYQSGARFDRIRNYTQEAIRIHRAYLDEYLGLNQDNNVGNQGEDEEAERMGIIDECGGDDEAIDRIKPLSFAPFETPQRDVVRAIAPVRDAGGRVRTEGVWDTALYIEQPNQIRPSRGDYQDKHGLQRYRAGRVRAFFTLPGHLLEYYSGQLAYIEVFRPFEATPASPYGRMFSTAPELDARDRRRTIIVPVTEIIATCHLVPKFNQLDPGLRLDPYTDVFTGSSDALDLSTDFALSVGDQSLL
ncbi:Zn-finger protein [Rhizoctonia solani]|uniref:Zn-finger protein n=1 Tax=Rhizoctonia solani TaxID=456999 RepID=A0A8H7IK99_9AGAM|nr:Zn-finger protein [Rhizoctonia solani]